MMKRSWRRSLPAIAACAVASIAAVGAHAQQGRGAVVPVPYMLACSTTEQLVAALGANGEIIAARGASIGGPVTQFWINRITREWSVVFVDPTSGQSCLVAAGSDFKAERIDPRPPDPSTERRS